MTTDKMTTLSPDKPHAQEHAPGIARVGPLGGDQGELFTAAGASGFYVHRGLQDEANSDDGESSDANNGGTERDFFKYRF